MSLSIIITEHGGSGKSFVIRALQNLLSGTCIITSYYGIAAFNIAGVTMQSHLRIPINGKNACDLKGKTLAQLQDKLKGINYIIIDITSLLDRICLGGLTED